MGRPYLADALRAGRIPPAMRQRVMARDNFTCHYCGGRATEVDHWTPASRGGLTVEWNLVAACGPCNRSKGDRTPVEWRTDQATARVQAKQLPLQRRRVRRARGRLP